MSTALSVVDRGATARQDFSGHELSRTAETAAMAVAAREQAAIQARYLMAERHTRDIEEFRVALEKECSRPSFAAVAIYRKPVGKKWNAETRKEEEQFIEGPSIRFIETALRCYRNVFPEVTTVYDSDEIRICRVTVTDLEANLSYSTEVTIRKEVERKGKKRDGKVQPPEGREILSERINSWGDPVWLVRATDDELQVRQNALLSKAIRTNGQRLLPGDIIEACTKIIKKTQADRDAKDPDAAKREILDAFDDIGVRPIDIQAFVGHALDRLQPADLKDLRGIYSAIKNGEATWKEIMEAREPQGSEAAAQAVAEEKLRKAAASTSATQTQATAAAPTPQSSDPSPQPVGSGPAPVADPAPLANDATTTRFNAWEEINDPLDPRLGLKVEVAGDIYTRQMTDQTWTRAEKPSAGFPKRGGSK